MKVLGEVFLQVMAFSSGLLVLALIVAGIYMRVSRRDPFTGKTCRSLDPSFSGCTAFSRLSCCSHRLWIA
jgi:hypothetical protein